MLSLAFTSEALANRPCSLKSRLDRMIGHYSTERALVLRDRASISRLLLESRLDPALRDQYEDLLLLESWPDSFEKGIPLALKSLPNSARSLDLLRRYLGYVADMPSEMHGEALALLPEVVGQKPIASESVRIFLRREADTVLDRLVNSSGLPGDLAADYSRRLHALGLTFDETLELSRALRVPPSRADVPELLDTYLRFTWTLGSGMSKAGKASVRGMRSDAIAAIPELLSAKAKDVPKSPALRKFREFQGMVRNALEQSKKEAIEALTVGGKRLDEAEEMAEVVARQEADAFADQWLAQRSKRGKEKHPELQPLLDPISVQAGKRTIEALIKRSGLSADLNRIYRGLFADLMLPADEAEALARGLKQLPENEKDAELLDAYVQFAWSQKGKRDQLSALEQAGSLFGAQVKPRYVRKFFARRNAVERFEEYWKRRISLGHDVDNLTRLIRPEWKGLDRGSWYIPVGPKKRHSPDEALKIAAERRKKLEALQASPRSSGVSSRRDHRKALEQFESLIALLVCRIWRPVPIVRE